VTAVKLSPYWKFGVHGAHPKGLSGNVVVVSNHESLADAFLISHLPWEMKWLGKKVLFRIPIFGWSMAMAGDIPVTRGDGESGRQALEACARWLRQGMPVMIFPEGTRSRDGQLQAFKDGAFRLAIAEQSDVLPVAVSGTLRALPKASWRFAKSRALVMVGTPVSAKGMTEADLPRLKAEVRAQIEAMREQLRPLTSAV
jgi:1-acyl-sn-glycerol-3-phosphate acyltransferase